MDVFSEVVPMSRVDLEAAFASQDERKICQALVSAAFHDPDWRWVQEKSLGFLENESDTVSGLAATCLGHIARIHGVLEKDRVVSALHKAMGREALVGRIEDALDDIQMFVE